MIAVGMLYVVSSAGEIPQANSQSRPGNYWAEEGDRQFQGLELHFIFDPMSTS